MPAGPIAHAESHIAAGSALDGLSAPRRGIQRITALELDLEHAKRAETFCNPLIPMLLFGGELVTQLDEPTFGWTTRTSGEVDTWSGTMFLSSAVLTRNWSSSGSHTVVLQVVGTSGRPAIDVDAFVALR